MFFALKAVWQDNKLLGEKVKADESWYIISAKDSFHYSVVKPTRTWSQGYQNEYNSPVVSQELNFMITVL